MRVVLMAVALLVASSAYAQETPFSGNNLLSGCRDFSADKPNAKSNAQAVFKQGVCVGIISTVVDMGRMYEKNKFCAPRDLDIKEVIGIVVNYLDTHREAMKDDVRLVSWGLFNSAWPSLKK
jgi:hypothetical protein